MWDRINWLFLWMTLAFWSGCAMDDQNYQINDERSPLFEESYPTQPGGETAQPSLSGIDRADWPTTAVGPVSGRSPHHPLYFRHADEQGARPSPLARGTEDIYPRALAATSGAFEPPHTGKYGHIAHETLRYGADVLKWPFRAYETHPLSTQYTPRP
ncbi:MAG: hypothetical protein OER86_05245 [Phycisphaerae bacterium]|nr:hypothetical protein [Phycisphaerae bacterium]